MNHVSRILILDDDATDAELIRHALQNSQCIAEVCAVRTEAEFREKLSESSFDLILSDYAMPGFDGHAALAVRNSICPQTPFIILSGTIDEEIAVELFHQGATDCIFKSQLSRLGPTVQRAQRESAQTRERERVERTARERTNFLQLQQVIAVAANEAGSVQEALQSGLDLICAYAGFPVGHAFAIERATDETIVSAGVWHLEDEARYEPFRTGTSATRFQRDEGLVGRVIASGVPVWAENLSDVPEFRRKIIAESVGLRSGVAFPISSGKTAVALLEFFSDKVVPPNQRLLDVMVYVGTQLGRVLEREQAEGALRERAQRQAAVARLGQRALEETDVTILVQEALALAAEALKAEFGAVLEWADDGDTLRRRATLGWAETNTPDTELDIDLKSLASYVVTHIEPVIVRDVETETRFATGRRLRDHSANSCVAVGIAVPNWQLGTLALFSKEPDFFLPPDVEFLQTIAGLLASALERERTTAALRLLHSAIEQTTEAITVTDAQLTRPGPHILFVNAAFTRITGYSAREVIGFSPRMLQGPKTDRAVLNKLRTSLLAGEHASCETINYRRDGSEFWMEWTVAPVRDAAGKITQFFAIQRDVTARKEAEAALRESRANLAEAQRLTSLGSWECDLLEFDDLNCNPLRWSDEVFRIFGYEPGAIEVSNENFFNAVHPDDREPIAAAVRRAIETRSAYSLDHRVILPDGTERIVHEEAKVIYDEASGQALKMTGIVQDITERRRSEEARHESEVRFRATFEQAAVGLAHTDVEGHYLRVNQRLCEIIGYTREELHEKEFFEIIHPDDVDQARKDRVALLAGEVKTTSSEKRYVSKNGAAIWTNVTTSLVHAADGTPEYFIAVIEDISSRKRLEQQYLQAQKMEAFGRLAGGVAHDFNNLLTVINGYNSIILDDLPVGDPRREYAEEVGKAADRASALTNQLLAFSRQQVLQPKIFNPNAVLEDVEKMLRRIIGEDVELTTELDEQLGNVRADVSQIENVLVNMAVNARDAMLRGGTLTIRTKNFTATEKEEIPSGEYVCLSIEDTGSGMSDEVKARIFEPFFTTKEIGQGTGLGLATCYGIVSQSGGHIAVESQLGRGTTFTIYLPRVDELPENAAVSAEFRELPRGTETILVVEDDPVVRKLTRWVLGALGYQILEAANGDDAFNVLQTHKGDRLHLALTDVVMPRMSGKDLAFWIRASHPDAKILFMSGYPNHELDDTASLGGHVEFLRKPFTPKELARKVRGMLDQA